MLVLEPKVITNFAIKYQGIIFVGKDTLFLFNQSQSKSPRLETPRFHQAIISALSLSSKSAVAVTGKILGILKQTLENWVRLAQKGQLKGSVDKPVSPEQMELVRLRAENVNAPTESFWGRLKVGRLYGRKFATRKQALDEVIDQMTFYNHRRIDSTSGNVSPMQLEKSRHAAQLKKAA